MRRQHALVTGVVAVMFGTGCPPERAFPDQVAMGVARLTMRSAGNLVSILESNELCGFASDAGKVATLDGEVGGHGSASFRVEGCDIDFGAPFVVSEDCKGIKTLAAGRAHVTATKTIRGRLTGNAAQPVVPDGADAVTFSVDATFHGFVIQVSGSDQYMSIKTGGLSYELSPHLAVSESLNLCAIPTTDVSFSNVKWKDASVEVTNGNRKFDVTVEDSNLSAQAGKWGDKENFLDGKITVWGGEQDIPSANDKKGLDPEYNADKDREAFECKSDLKLPKSYECPSLTPRLSEGAARLTVSMFGNVASLVDADTSCGFSSPAVLSNPQITGDLGVPGGQATFTIASPCTISFPAGAVISSDCGGVETSVQGSITVTGTKTLRGIRSGDPDAPIVPTSRDPADITLGITFNGFRLSTSNSGNALSGLAGTLTGTMHPRVGKDTELGACAISTSIVTFEDLTWNNGDVKLESDGNKFKLHLDASDLNAQSGNKDGVENRLEGVITVDGEQFTVPLEGNTLDPEYKAENFLASFSCKPHFQMVGSDEECSLKPTLTDGAARLSIATFGTLVSITDANTACGFSSDGVLNGAVVNGDLGRRGGDATFTISTPCTINFPTRTEISRDCQGVVTYAQGTALVTGTKKLRGIVTGDPTQPIVPTSRDPAEIHLVVTLQDFTVSMSNSDKSLTFTSGGLDGTIYPRVALDTELGACSVATPVVQFDDIHVTGASTLLHSGAKSFKLNIQNAQLSAQNGSKDGRTNWLSGNLVSDGETVPVPRDPGNPVLNPDYVQGTFDASYACTPNMRVPADDGECSFYRTLAENTGRLMIETVGTVGTMVNKDSGCGFENYLTLIAPDHVEGDSGEEGSITWSITDCEVGFDPEQSYEHDCLGGDLWVGGFAATDATRTVHGTREKKLVFIDSIRPNQRQDVDIHLDNVVFTDFYAEYVPAGEIVGEGVMVIHRGRMTGRIQPYLGERNSERGLFDVSTFVQWGISKLEDVQLIDADITLYAKGKVFKYRVGNASVDGFNGSYHADSNWVAGTVDIDGQSITFGHIPLNPHFNQQEFNEGYACVDDLVSVINPNE